jgi:hypothetical protein
MKRSSFTTRIALGALLVVFTGGATLHWRPVFAGARLLQPLASHESGTQRLLVSTDFRRPLDYYTGSSLSDLFGGRTAAPALQMGGAARAAVALSTPSQPATAPDPLAEYVLSGLITVDGRIYALLEHRTTRVGEYYAVGDDFQGFKIAEIGSDSITLAVGGKPRRVAMNENFTLTPFDRDAPKLAGGPGKAVGGVPQPGGQEQTEETPTVESGGAEEAEAQAVVPTFETQIEGPVMIEGPVIIDTSGGEGID